MAKMKEKPSGRRINGKVLQKLDGGLRRLLRMTDQEIIKAVKAHRTRLEKEIKRTEELDKVFALDAKSEEGRAIERIKRQHLRKLTPHPVFGVVHVAKLKPFTITVRAVVHFTGNREDLTAMGLECRSQAHDIFTIVGTPQQLLNLAAQDATVRIKLPRLLLPTLDNAAGQAEIAAVHQGTPGFEGNGVIVGIIDGALDVTHPTFRDPTTQNTRVLYYWVQTPDAASAPGQTPEQFTQQNQAAIPPIPGPNFMGLNYGRLYTEADLNAALASAGTTPANAYGNGANQISCRPGAGEHGTHVAGIAVGNGQNRNWNTTNWIGAAPQATIVYVKYWHSITGATYDATFEDNIIDAINLIFRAADFHQMPAVINVSRGNNLGPHNGNELFDMDRDNRVNSWDDRAIVWSAGNDNADNGFRQGTIAANSTETLTLTPTRVPSTGPEQALDRYLEVWYRGPEPDFEVQCGPSASGWQAAGGPDYSASLNGYDVFADREAESVDGWRNLRFTFYWLVSADPPWTIRLRNPHASDPVQYNAWAGPQGWHGDINNPIQHWLTLLDSGCCKSVLTVGACSKIPMNPANDEPCTVFSGAGPTLDGRIKPEIVCVGENITSANSDLDPKASSWTQMSGTSMAAPLVAGAVALLFEEALSLPQPRHLNADTIKALLTQNTNALKLDLDPAKPGYDPIDRNRYGYGRLRMLAPIDYLAPPLDINLWVRTADDDYGEEPYLGDCFCGSPDIKVFAAGTTNELYQLTWGTTYDVKVTVRNLGDDDAANSTVRLKYTLPWTAPNDWTPAQNASDKVLETQITVPALDQFEVTFSWRPEKNEISGAPAGATHFCLLAEVDHSKDVLNYEAPSAGGGDAWSTNIKGTNNVALRNVHIQ